MGAARKLEAKDGAFLGVVASARGFTWRDRLSPAAQTIAEAISQRIASEMRLSPLMSTGTW